MSYRVRPDYRPGLRYHRPSLLVRSLKYILFTLPLILVFAVYFFASNAHANKDSDFETHSVSIPQLSEVTTPSDNAAKLISEWKTIKVKKGDNLSSLMSNIGVGAQQISEFLSLGEHSKLLERVFPGQTIQLQMSDDGEILALSKDLDEISTLSIERKDSKITSNISQKPVESRTAFGGATIKQSLYLAAKQAQLDDGLIMQLANIFGYDIDFALDVQPNDSFKVLYEQQYIGGNLIKNGAILAAEFTNRGKHYRAIRHVGANGKSEYYTPDGKSLKKAFIRNPVEYTRISSHFNLKRKHPILHRIRAHKGVDYAAPRGTPIRAAGDGKITFRGRKGGYGNAVVIQHGKKYSTLYAHMSKFSKNFKTGSRIQQGEVLGYVGTTGLADGPHLHFEFRVNGVHKNPLTVALPKARDISNQHKSEFLTYASDMMNLIRHHEKVILAARD